MLQGNENDEIKLGDYNLAVTADHPPAAYSQLPSDVSYLSIYLSIYLFIYLSISLSLYLSIYLFIYLFIYLGTSAKSQMDR